MVVFAIHVGVAFAVVASAGGKLGSHDMSGGKMSLGGIAKNTAFAVQLVGAPACWMMTSCAKRENEITLP